MGCSASNAAASVSSDFHSEYLLGDVLGRGSFAQVRACTRVLKKKQRQLALPEESAVKILDVTYEKKEEAAEREAIAWQKVASHPNCVELLDVFNNGIFCYMLMEKMSCSFLNAMEAMPELTEFTLAPVFTQMLCAIEHCHSVGVVHRDVKPENFMASLEDGLTIKLGDFGVSAIMPEQAKLTGVYGTAPYMCPEMLIDGSYDEKADVWSLGVMVYTLLFGAFPYTTEVRSSKAMQQAIVAGETPSFQPTQPGATPVSPKMIAFVRSLLQRDAALRATAAEALDAADALESRCISEGEFPCLKPMLESAKRNGVFNLRDPCKAETGADLLLSKLQQKKHGKPLPAAGAAAPKPVLSLAVGSYGASKPRRNTLASSTSTTFSCSGSSGSRTRSKNPSFLSDFSHPPVSPACTRL